MTLDIKILGPGCANCYRLEGLAVAAVQFLQSQKPELFRDVEVALDHLSTPGDFRKYGVLRTPGLVVNEKLAVAGRLPSVLGSWICLKGPWRATRPRRRALKRPCHDANAACGSGSP